MIPYSHPAAKAERFPRIVLSLQNFAEGEGTASRTADTGDLASSDPATRGTGKTESLDPHTPSLPNSSDDLSDDARPDDARPDDPPDYDKEFDDFMARPEMKERMNRHTRGAVMSRFKTAEAESKAARELTEFLAARYGVDPTDTKAVRAAVEADVAYDSERAEESGMDLATYQEVTRYRAKARMEEARRRETEAARATAALRMEARRLSAEFPDFDFDTAMADETFKRMTDAGVDLRTAYIARNVDRAVPAAVRHAKREAEARVTATVRANRARPQEGGTVGSHTPDRSTVDYGKMSDAEWRTVIEKRNKGEPISFV